MSATTFLFRVDASDLIGTGHVMRSLTLAMALRERGVDCFFVCRKYSGNLLEFIRKRGFEALGIEAPSFNEDLTNVGLVDEFGSSRDLGGAIWQADAQETLELIGVKTIDWIIVDNYAIDARWENTLRSCARVRLD